MSFADTSAGETGNLMLRVGSVGSFETKPLFPVDSRPEVTSQGYILYVRHEILMASRFDFDKLEVVGEPQPLTDEVGKETMSLAHFGASDEGTLVFQPGLESLRGELVWVNRTGHQLSAEGTPDLYRDIAISPDGTRLAYSLLDSEQNNEDIWIRDLRRQVSSRLTFDAAADVWPVWPPDGERLVFASERSGHFRVWQRLANGMGSAELLFDIDSGMVGPFCFSSDGDRLCYAWIQNSWDVWEVDLAEGGTSSPWLTTPFNLRRAVYSPDDRFLAYQSNESGQYEIYIRDLGPSGGKWQISTGGGEQPKWRADGRELFYWTPDSDLMAVSIAGGDHFEAGIPEQLFSRPLHVVGTQLYRYDVTADGQRFLLIVPVESQTRAEFVVVLNWIEELKSR